MKTQTLFALFAILVAVVTPQDYGQVYCGRRLATVLDYMCEGNLIKRSEAHHSKVDVDPAWPWIEEHKALSMGRSKRQVVAECCEKPCTIDELMTYCGN